MITTSIKVKALPLFCLILKGVDILPLGMSVVATLTFPPGALKWPKKSKIENKYYKYDNINVNFS